MTNRNTFENIERWNDKFDDRDKEGVETVKVLVGCKSDLDDLRQVGQIRKQLELVFFLLISRQHRRVQKQRL